MPFFSQPANISSSAQISPNAVEESDIVDNAVTLAKMAGGADGSIITFDANGDPVALAPGTSGQLLETQGAGAAPVWATALADWVQLGETILGAAGAVLSVAGFAGRQDLRVVIVGLDPSSTTEWDLTFNSDTGANYGYGSSVNGGALAATATDNSIEPFGIGTQPAQSSVLDMLITDNVAARRKLFTYLGTVNGAGAAGAGAIVHGGGAWNNTAAQVTTITLTKRTGGTLAIGSRMTVYGKRD